MKTEPVTQEQRTEIDNADMRTRWSTPRKTHDYTNPPADPGIDFSNSPSLTDQTQVNDADINNILKTYNKTGIVRGMDPSQLIYGDFSHPMDYREAMEVVQNAEEMFASLDAFARKQFDNDPEKFLEFAQDPKNADKLVEYGLATLRPKSDTDRLVEAINASNSPSQADPELKPAVVGGSTKSKG